MTITHILLLSVIYIFGVFVVFCVLFFFLHAYYCLFLFVLIKMINCKCHPKWGLDDLVSFPTLGGTEEFTSCCL